MQFSSIFSNKASGFSMREAFAPKSQDGVLNFILRFLFSSGSLLS